MHSIGWFIEDGGHGKRDSLLVKIGGYTRAYEKGQILNTHPEGWEYMIQVDNHGRGYWFWVHPDTGAMKRDTGDCFGCL